MRAASATCTHEPTAVRTSYALILFLALQLAVGIAGAGTEAAETTPAGPALIRIDLDRAVTELGVPIVAHLQDAAGQPYALAMVPAVEAGDAGLSFQVLDTETANTTYLLGLERRSGARRQAAEQFDVLLDDGRRVLVRIDPARAAELAMLGLDLKVLPSMPISLEAPATQLPDAVVLDSEIETMIGEVQESALWDLIGDMTGENAVSIGGYPYTITTRLTSSGEPITKATTYVWERMKALGYNTFYQPWSSGSYFCKNVVAEVAGKVTPEEIVLVTAHLDDVPWSGPAPGADDNASGSAALLAVAEIMSQRKFERTVRFVFFTGEEQGLYGSSAYAHICALNGNNIVAVLNLDMIAWEQTGGPVLRLHTRISSNPGYAADLEIANTFIDVVSTYALSGSLTPTLDADGATASDHSSFWDEGFPAVLAIEDDIGDFNPYYHSTNDLRQNLDMAYYTAYVKAVVGTAAHLAVRTEVPVELMSFAIE